MTKNQLIEALNMYDDDQEVIIFLHSLEYPNGSQVVIQGIKTSKPWRKGPKDIIGIVAHSGNKALRTQDTHD